MVGPLALENKIFFHKYLASKDHILSCFSVTFFTYWYVARNSHMISKEIRTW